jgi:hypothetical protein
MSRIAKQLSSPGMLIALLALIAAVAGTAVAGQLAGKSALSKKEKKQTRNIATGVIQGLAPGLSVRQAANADKVNGVGEGAITLSRSGSDDSCDPFGSSTFTDCVGVDLNLPRTARVLLVATGGQTTFSAAPAHGDCRLEVDDSPGAVPGLNVISPGEITANTTNNERGNGFAYTAVTEVLGAGVHTFELSCDEDDPDTEIDDSSITATMIGSA